jgi:hypothetical protein
MENEIYAIYLSLAQRSLVKPYNRTIGKMGKRHSRY